MILEVSKGHDGKAVPFVQSSFNMNRDLEKI